MSKVIVDYAKCDSVANLIKSYMIPTDKEEPTNINLPADVTKNFYFMLVAICHQTTPLVGQPLTGYINSKQYRGFDYLREKLLNVVSNDNSIVYPDRLSKITGEDIIELLRDEKGESKISDTDGRARLLNDIGAKMESIGWTSIQDIYDLSEGFVASENGRGLYNILSNFEAYSDPVKKKSSYLFSIMKNEKFWSFNDDDKLLPPVDYHETRLALRQGTIKIVDKDLRRKILNKEEVTQDEDIEIRRSVQDAMVYIGRNTGFSHAKLHYYFWNHARNCCSRDSPHCFVHPDNDTLPERYSNRSLQMFNHPSGCVIGSVCDSKGLPNEMKPVDHKVNTHFY